MAKLMMVSAGLSALSSIYGGKAAKASADAEARVMRFNANTTRIAANRAFHEKQRDKRLIVSRARVAGGASGAGVYGDPGYEEQEALLTAEGELQARSILWAGENQAVGQEYAADVRKAEGIAARTAGFLTAGGTLMTAYGIHKADFSDADELQKINMLSRLS